MTVLWGSRGRVCLPSAPSWGPSRGLGVHTCACMPAVLRGACWSTGQTEAGSCRSAVQTMCPGSSVLGPASSSCRATCLPKEMIHPLPCRIIGKTLQHPLYSGEHGARVGKDRPRSHRGQDQRPGLRLQPGLRLGSLFKSPCCLPLPGPTWPTPDHRGDLEEGCLQLCLGLPWPLSSSSFPSPRGHRSPFHVGRKLSACLQEQLGLVPSAAA